LVAETKEESKDSLLDLENHKDSEAPVRSNELEEVKN